MDRRHKSLVDASELLQVSKIISAAVHTVIDEWAKETQPGTASTTDILPSPALYRAQRTILAATGKLTELVSEPPNRVLEVACQYWECRALSIAAERRIPDLLAANEREGKDGVNVQALAEATGIERLKLCTSIQRSKRFFWP
jgi:hypothetical protein